MALLIFLFGSRALQNAVAEGDTRTISMHHTHTGEDITITYKRDGRYDEGALDKINWFLRDWRRGEQTRMDPHLIDLVWEVQREAATKETIQVVCGYRSPQTNAMLRRRSGGVARFSQHMLGHAMDFYISGIPLEQLREIGLRLQRGGVGFYPESGSPFVHMDTGDVRMWPRMTREQLARVFPDGRTVLIPTDGKPLTGYALALADLRDRGGAPSDGSIEAARNAGIDVGTVVASNDASGNPFAKLLNRAGDDDDEDSATAAASAPAVASAAVAVKAQQKPPIPTPAPARSMSAKPVPTPAADATGVKLASDLSKLKLVHVAELLPVPSVAPAPSRSGENAQSSPNQVILDRGYWEGPPDGMAVIGPLSGRSPRFGAVSNGNNAAGGAIGPFNDSRTNSVAPELALAYAAAPATETVREDPAAETAPSAQIAPNATTIVIKRLANEAASAIMTTGASTIVAVKTGIRLENPWMRAIVLAPSVHHFLTTLALGTRDFRTLAALMVKPRRAVMMTFAADPNPGLEHDRFSGAAVVFVSTVSYPTRTIALQ